MPSLICLEKEEKEDGWDAAVVVVDAGQWRLDTAALQYPTESSTLHSAKPPSLLCKTQLHDALCQARPGGVKRHPFSSLQLCGTNIPLLTPFFICRASSSMTLKYSWPWRESLLTSSTHQVVVVMAGLMAVLRQISRTSHLPSLSHWLTAYTSLTSPDQQLIIRAERWLPAITNAGKLGPQPPQSPSLSMICVNYEPVVAFHCLSVVV